MAYTSSCSRPRSAPGRGKRCWKVSGEHLTTLPVAALMSGFDEAPPGNGLAAYMPWPCRTAELSREIEEVLSRDGSDDA